jgi:hypothetical protein
MNWTTLFNIMLSLTSSFSSSSFSSYHHELSFKQSAEIFFSWLIHMLVGRGKRRQFGSLKIILKKATLNIKSQASSFDDGKRM